MGKMISALLLLVIGFVGLGFYLNWFQLDRQSNAKESTVSLKINREKIQEDTQTAAEKTREFGQTAVQKGNEAVKSAQDKFQDLSARQTTHGTLKEINVDQSKFTLANADGKIMPIQVTDKTTIERDGVRIALNDLVVGQPVTVVYTTQENERVAESVRVATK